MDTVKWIKQCIGNLMPQGPKEHNRFNVKQFPVVAQLYFGVQHECVHARAGGADHLTTCGRRAA